MHWFNFCAGEKCKGCARCIFCYDWVTLGCSYMTENQKQFNSVILIQRFLQQYCFMLLYSKEELVLVSLARNLVILVKTVWCRVSKCSYLSSSISSCDHLELKIASCRDGIAVGPSRVLTILLTGGKMAKFVFLNRSVSADKTLVAHST